MQLQQLVNQRNILAAQASSEATRLRAASLTPRLVKFRHIKSIEIVGVPSGAIINLPPDGQSADAGTPAESQPTPQSAAGQDQAAQ